MRRLAAFLLACACLSGCASGAKKDAAEAARKDAETAATLRKAFDAGRTVALQDPAFVPQLEEATLAYLLYRSAGASYAGARRLLDLRDRLPGHPLLAIYLPAEAEGRNFGFQEEDAFRTGAYFNSYEVALFSPFFRQTLREYLGQASWDEAGLLRLKKRLDLALRFTPRYAGVYPNQISSDGRKALEEYLKKDEPSGPTADRLHMLLWWDERNSAWAGGRREADAKLKALQASTSDELLKLELKDALAAPVARPERAFWMSFVVPGLGQISQGDLQGGLLLGGLTVAAWVWMGAKLALAQQTSDDATRKVAYGDAAFAGSLALLGHGFTAMNAAENARFMNIVVEWDLLSKPRLQ